MSKIHKFYRFNVFMNNKHAIKHINGKKTRFLGPFLKKKIVLLSHKSHSSIIEYLFSWLINRKHILLHHQNYKFVILNPKNEYLFVNTFYSKYKEKTFLDVFN